MQIKVFLIVYKNKEMLQLNLECLQSISRLNKEDVVIIDMGFDERIKEWLETQAEYNYICADKLENYANIINTAINEFSTAEDIFFLNDNYICLEGCLQCLEEVYICDREVGVVFPTNFATVCPQKPDLSKTLEIVSENADEIEVEMALKIPYQYFFLARKCIDEIGMFDEGLLLPDSLMMDYSFRVMCRKWKVIVAKNAYVYEVTPQVDCYAAFLGEDVDRSSLKEKWGMNYFNGVPNENLVQAIKQNKDDEFTVLEIGCDCGANLLRIKNLFPKARLYGAEINSNAARIASGVCEVFIGNIEDMDLPYQERKFDYILFGDVLEHLRDPERIIGYCKPFLKPKGVIIASIPNLMHYSVLKSLIGGDFTYQDMGLLDRTHIHFFTYNEIIRMFLRTGYQIEGCTYTMVGGMSEEDKEFVAEIKKLGGCETFFYLAYQYLIVAGCND